MHVLKEFIVKMASHKINDRFHEISVSIHGEYVCVCVNWQFYLTNIEMYKSNISKKNMAGEARLPGIKVF